MGAKVVKMCDMPISIAIRVFEALNADKVKVVSSYMGQGWMIITDTEPIDLVYPEGWYYAKGTFRNKHMSTTGMYEYSYMMTTGGTLWSKKATYCTLD